MNVVETPDTVFSWMAVFPYIIVCKIPKKSLNKVKNNNNNNNTKML